MADDNNNIMFGNSFRLHPNESTGAKLGKPTELNFGKVTENTLHMRRYADEYGGGRRGGVWWYIWSIILSSIIMFWPGKSVEEELFIAIIVVIFISSFIIPLLIIWRRELPICFNRNTRTVSYWIKGELAQVNWDEIVAYAKTKRTVTPGSGALIKEQLINFNIAVRGGWEHDLGIAACDFSGSEDPVAEAKGLWEYIRKFMDEGKQALPETKVNTRICSIKESLIDSSPFPRKGTPFIAKIITYLFVPIKIPFIIIIVMTDMVYCVLDIILPKRKPPKPLREACEAGK